VSRIDGLEGLDIGLQQTADDFTKSVAAITHREQFQCVVRAHGAPSRRDGLGGLLGSQRALKLVRTNQNLHPSNVQSPLPKVNPEICKFGVHALACRAAADTLKGGHRTLDTAKSLDLAVALFQRCFFIKAWTDHMMTKLEEQDWGKTPDGTVVKLLPWRTAKARSPASRRMALF